MAARAGSPRPRYDREKQSKKHPQLQELLCRAASKKQHRRIPHVGGNSSHSCISVQDLLIPLEIKPNMTQAERSATTLTPTLTIPASLSNSSPLKYYFCHFSSPRRPHRPDFWEGSWTKLYPDVYEQAKGKHSIGATLKPVTDKVQCWVRGEQNNCWSRSQEQPLWETLPGAIPTPWSYLPQHKKAHL